MNNKIFNFFRYGTFLNPHEEEKKILDKKNNNYKEVKKIDKQFEKDDFLPLVIAAYKVFLPPIIIMVVILCIIVYGIF